MKRSMLVLLLSLALAAPAAAQRAPDPPAKGHQKHKGKGHHKRKGEGHKKHKKDPDAPPERTRRRAPPSGEPQMPVRQPPVVHEFEPERGSPNSLVTIKGEHFDYTCKVRFNGRWLPITARSPESLTVRMPRTAVSDVFVVAKAGFNDVTLDKTFHVVRPPKIKHFQPRQVHVGDQVTLIGAHFLPSDSYALGPNPMEVLEFKHDRVVLRVPQSGSRNYIRVLRDGRQASRSAAPLDVLLPPPVVNDFSPRRGSAGTVVRLAGDNFEEFDEVTLDGRKMRIVRRGPTFIEAKVDRRHNTGALVVTGRRGRRAQADGEFLVIRPPRVQRFTPTYGSPGTVISIFGVGFLEGDQVQIGDAMLTVRTVADQKIMAELPAGVQSGKLFVVRDGRKFGVRRGRFEVILPPTIAEMTPRLGPPGTRVTLRGEHFMRGTEVLLAGTKLKMVARPRPNELQVEIPEGARTGNMVVVTRAGSVQTPTLFRVTAVANVRSFYPLHGLPGTKVTLRGDHFHPGIKAMLGPVELPARVVSPSELEVEIPENAPTAPFTLLSYGRKVQSPIKFTVDQPRPEVVFTVAPLRGRRGSEVTLTLDPPRQEAMVFFNDRPLPKKVLRGGKHLVVTIPGDAQSGFFELQVGDKRYRAEQKFIVR